MHHQSGLLADLYELTMAAGYVQTRFEARATFELFVRSLPPRRSYLVAAGLEQALDFLENVRFAEDEISYLRAHPVFQHIGPEFFDYLRGFRFTGDVWSMPEGTLFFPDEPMLRVTAPIAEAQIVETCLLATLHFQTLVASKAVRVVTAAEGRKVIEFGTRRAHGIEAGVLAARAAFLGGCQGTSNVLAGQRFGIPTYGTQAHSWIMAHENEEEAFGKFLDIFPEHAVLLLDTYDVRAAVEKIIAMGRKPRGVRLDSGALAADSAWVRRRLDEAGWADVEVFASGDLDEDRIAELLESGARIDSFGVGTALATSADAPALGVIYKLVELERGGAIHNAAKFSEAKVTYPGRKQVFRFADRAGKYTEDVIALEEEHFPHAESLLREVMRGGKRSEPATDLAEARKRCLAGLEHLPESVRYAQLGRPTRAPRGQTSSYPVRHSARLEELFEQMRRRVERAARI
jgi:nicotinate phosphoribosyltransferase